VAGCAIAALATVEWTDATTYLFGLFVALTSPLMLLGGFIEPVPVILFGSEVLLLSAFIIFGVKKDHPKLAERGSFFTVLVAQAIAGYLAILIASC